MKTQPDKVKMEKALKEALKRVESKESQFQNNAAQAAIKHQIANKGKTQPK